VSPRGTNGARNHGFYSSPDIANAGNVINETYTAAQVQTILDGGDVIDCKVGGGLMGHPLASENEAPMSLTLATWLVRSYAPPGGRVLDPFMGSGTTLHACMDTGRIGVGIDLRESQIELTRRRLQSVTPTMFDEA
jgi:2-polyprenyl-3-methyl-5-hydroxy-6-metoxy-1,4-benzoquinol methylase